MSKSKARTITLTRAGMWKVWQDTQDPERKFRIWLKLMNGARK